MFGSSPIYRQIYNIISKATGAINNIDVVFKTGKDTVTPYNVDGVHVIRDYVKAYGDETYVDVWMNQGDYLYRLLKHQQDITAIVTITPNPMYNTGSSVYAKPIVIYCKALPLNTSDRMAVGGHTAYGEYAVLKNSSINKYSFQLVDIGLYKMSSMEIGNIYSNNNVHDIIKNELLKLKTELSTLPNASLKGMSIVAPDNLEVQNFVSIPHGVPFTSLIDVLQDMVGIYKYEASFYFQDSTVYVYPVYNTDRHDTTHSSCNIWAVPQNKIPKLEHTYMYNNGKVDLISTGESKITDFTNFKQLMGGTGLRYLPIDNFLEGFVESKEGKSTVNRQKNAREFTISNRKDNLKVAKTLGRSTDRVLTSNPYSGLSKVSSFIGRSLQVRWEFSNKDLIYPGMPVKYYYYVSGAVYCLSGVITATETVYQRMSMDNTSKAFQANTAITVFVESEPTILKTS